MSRTVLITGTTSGIGKALCDRFAKEKYKLILVSRNILLLKKQAEELIQRGIEIHTIPCDLAHPDAVHTILNYIRDENLTVDILVNNAGFNEAGSFWETSLEKEIGMIQVHIRVMTELTKGVLPGMLERHSGKILNIGSTGSYMACPSDAVYAATKAYVLSFSNALYQELMGTGVTMTTLCPGATRTSFADKAKIDKTLLFRFFVMQPSRVADIGYVNMMKGRRTVTAGIYNKMLVAFTRLLPVGVLNVTIQLMLKKQADHPPDHT